jgi:Flp pilus assembly protein protease CpaA
MSLAILEIPLAVIGVGLCVAAVTDLWSFKVHNLLTLPLLLSGLLYHLAVHGGPGLTASLQGAAFGLLVLFPFHLMGGIGGGDVKLMAAVGAWLGLPLTFSVFIVSSLATGIYAVALIVAHGQWRRTWINLQIAWFRLAASGQPSAGEHRVEVEVKGAECRKHCIPFAAMTAIGLVGTLAWLFLARDQGASP